MWIGISPWPNSMHVTCQYDFYDSFSKVGVFFLKLSANCQLNNLTVILFAENTEENKQIFRLKLLIPSWNHTLEDNIKLAYILNIKTNFISHEVIQNNLRDLESIEYETTNEVYE